MHPNSYRLAWVNDTFVPVRSHCLVIFLIGNNFEQTVWRDVPFMKVVHILLGRP